MKARIVLLGLMIVAISMTSISNATAYEVIDLGALGSNLKASGINNIGQVAGYILGPHAFLWDSTNGIQDLGTLGGDETWARAISENGKVVGGSSLSGNPPGGCPAPIGCPYHAFLYEGGVMQDLGTLGGDRAEAYAVNIQGQVAGWSDTTGNTATHAFLYDNGVMHDLGNFGASVNNSWAYGINNNGQVVGSAGGLSGGRHAFLYESGVMQDLGTLGGSWSEARAISDNGKIVGTSVISGNTDYHAFLYEGGVMQDLGTLGGSSSHAYAVNDKGQIVGASMVAGNTAWHAFLYKDGIMLDLNELINDPQWVFTSANDINELGQIVGEGNIDLNGDGSFEATHAFLLTPIPEPTIITVDIDIKPGDSSNIINLRGMKTIPVAILSSADFYAPSEVEVNPTSLTFGGTGVEQSLRSCSTRKPKDVNGDGIKDLVCEFSTKLSFECGDTVGILKGLTTTGIAFEGRQVVVITPCK